MSTTANTLKQRAREELKRFLVIALYLWLVIGLLLLYKSMVLHEYHMSVVDRGLALINALALAKVMVVAEHFQLARRFDKYPLIYPTLLKAAVFTVVLICFKILEDVAIGFFRGKSFAQSIADMGGGSLSAILTLTLLLFVILIPFIAFGELKKALGEEATNQLFFRRRTPAAASQAGTARAA